MKELHQRMIIRLQAFLTQRLAESLRKQHENEASVLTVQDRTEVIKAVTQQVRRELKSLAPGPEAEQRKRRDSIQDKLFVALVDAVNSATEEADRQMDKFPLPDGTDKSSGDVEGIVYDDILTSMYDTTADPINSVALYKDTQTRLMRMLSRLKRQVNRGLALTSDLRRQEFLLHLNTIAADVRLDAEQVQGDPELMQILAEGSALARSAAVNNWQRAFRKVELERIRHELDALLTAESREEGPTPVPQTVPHSPVSRSDSKFSEHQSETAKVKETNGTSQGGKRIRNSRADSRTHTRRTGRLSNKRTESSASHTVGTAGPSPDISRRSSASVAESTTSSIAAPIVGAVDPVSGTIELNPVAVGRLASRVWEQRTSISPLVEPPDDPATAWRVFEQGLQRTTDSRTNSSVVSIHADTAQAREQSSAAVVTPGLQGDEPTEVTGISTDSLRQMVELMSAANITPAQMLELLQQMQETNEGSLDPVGTEHLSQPSVPLTHPSPQALNGELFTDPEGNHSTSSEIIEKALPNFAGVGHLGHTAQPQSAQDDNKPQQTGLEKASLQNRAQRDGERTAQPCVPVVSTRRDDNRPAWIAVDSSLHTTAVKIQPLSPLNPGTPLSPQQLVDHLRSIDVSPAAVTQLLQQHFATPSRTLHPSAPLPVVSRAIQDRHTGQVEEYSQRHRNTPSKERIPTDQGQFTVGSGILHTDKVKNDPAIPASNSSYSASSGELKNLETVGLGKGKQVAQRPRLFSHSSAHSGPPSRDDSTRDTHASSSGIAPFAIGTFSWKRTAQMLEEAGTRVLLISVGVQCELLRAQLPETTEAKVQTNAKPPPHLRRSWCWRCGAGPYQHPLVVCSQCNTRLLYLLTPGKAAEVATNYRLEQLRELLRKQRQVEDDLRFWDQQRQEIADAQRRLSLAAITVAGSRRVSAAPVSFAVVTDIAPPPPRAVHNGIAGRLFTTNPATWGTASGKGYDRNGLAATITITAAPVYVSTHAPHKLRPVRPEAVSRQRTSALTAGVAHPVSGRNSDPGLTTWRNVPSEGASAQISGSLTPIPPPTIPPVSPRIALVHSPQSPLRPFTLRPAVRGVLVAHPNKAFTLD
eukprot:TRINITY_DN9416_c0_g1_i1.p1 TRINITY_DN9416_c0_g1~~TRINITY_DN9416_c0_g1_i1.p1  ORF type:complete len:1096 (+),score=135.39 TRINITY_DN9416_c0_g1_i1:1069-4356(+)